MADLKRALEALAIGDLPPETFIVKAYQRGYRWGADEVRQLLVDLRRAIDGPADQDYLLQPIVVVPQGTDWELVDGQQRVTTLYLLLRHLHDRFGTPAPAFQLVYETRTATWNYVSADVWDDLKEANPTRPESNIDFCHLHDAAFTIRDYFKGLSHEEGELFHDFLKSRVKVIWYSAPDADATVLFTRLNAGKIPLTDAELVKALLLSRARGNAGDRDRAIEIAAQWDAFERDLSAPEVWAFASGKCEAIPTRIDLLLHAMSDQRTGRKPNEQRKPFEIFLELQKEIEDDWRAVWNEIVDLHSLVVGWYEDREGLFHNIGYLTAIGESIGPLLTEARTMKKDDFNGRVNAKIRTSISSSGTALTPDRLGDVTYADPELCTRVLLLMNAQTVAGTTSNSERFSFAEYASKRWSLEHIDAQHIQALTKESDWREWLDEHKQALMQFPNADGRRDDLLKQIDAVLLKKTIEGDDYEALSQATRDLEAELVDTPEVEKHSISNLALLRLDHNIRLTNSVFEVKRRKLLQLDKDGHFIPPSTRRVFLKYYGESDAKQLTLWGSKDRTAYLADMAAKLKPFMDVPAAGASDE